MVHVINNIPVYLPDVLVNIDEKSFRQYMTWQDDQKTLNKFPITKFENALLATLQYTDEKRPEEEKKDPVQVGELEFIVKTTPTKKRISYSTVYDRFKTFIQALEEFYNDERLRKDFRTLAPKHTNITLDLKELYVKNRIILEKMEEIKQASFEGKEGIKQEINLVKPAELLTALPDVIQINLDRNYAAVAESNARTYQEALNMVEEGTKRTVGFKTKVDGKTVYINRFKRLVLEDSLQIMGGTPKTVVAVMYPFETVSFKHQIEPREGISYEPVISEFIKEAPEKIRSNSTIGDLIMVNMIGTEAGKILTEKGIIKDEFLQDYDPQTEDGEMYIRIAGLKKRLEEYTKKNTGPTIEQNFFTMLPRLP
jgi:hypothetical protein